MLSLGAKEMKIVLMAFGSRGDVQPFLALAVALRERGHEVTLAAPADFEAQVLAYGVSYLRIPLNNMEILQRQSGKEFTTRVTPNTLRVLFRELIPEMKRALLSTAHIVADAARDADVLIAHGFLIPFAWSIHQHLHIPLMLSIAAPIIPTTAFPIFTPIPFAQRFYNPLTYHLLVRMITSFMIAPMNDYRRQVGLPKLSGGKVIQILFGEQLPMLMHYSRHLIPVPPDWGANVHVVGTWTLPAPPDWMPSDALRAFLAEGEPPVYIGFGSMVVSNPAKMAQTIAEGLRLAGLRGVLHGGWSGLSHDDDHLISIGDVPHVWLFPRMAAIVHHGGSGTTQAAARAGKPALIVPFSGDQPLWGRRLVALGVGVPPIAPHKLTPENLADALRALNQDKAMGQRAAELGERLRSEDGLAAAVALIEREITHA